MKALENGSTVLFIAPFSGDSTLVRTGVPSDGSCFFYSLLHSYDYKFRDLPLEKKELYISKLRKVLANKLDIVRWSKLGKGTVSEVKIITNFRKMMDSFYSYTSGSKDADTFDLVKELQLDNQDKKEKYILISEIFPKKIFIETLESSGLNFSDLEKKLKSTFEDELKKLGEDMDEETLKYFSKKFSLLITISLERCRKVCFEEFKNKLSDTKEWIDEFFLEYISEHFNRDIYIIDSKTRRPLKCVRKGKKSIIILWVQENHYEPIGRLIEGKKVDREFNPSDPLILSIQKS